MIANNMMNYNTKPTALIHHYAWLNLFLLWQSENAKETKAWIFSKDDGRVAGGWNNDLIV